MTKDDLISILNQLRLTQADAAQLLSVDSRTVRRWVENPSDIPGPAEQALRAWLALDRVGLPWDPDSVDIVRQDSEQIAEHRRHAIELDELLKKVEQRGGPAAPWKVDLDKRQATLGPLQVSFYRLINGGFSPQSYRGSPDIQRDWHLIEDAFAHIAQAIARERRAKGAKRVK